MTASRVQETASRIIGPDAASLARREKPSGKDSEITLHSLLLLTYPRLNQRADDILFFRFVLHVCLCCPYCNSKGGRHTYYSYIVHRLEVQR